MEVTLDQFGRILIPKKLRQLLRLHPGQRLELVTDQEKQQLIAIRLEENTEPVKIVCTDSGIPVIQNGAAEQQGFDSLAFLKSTREEYLDRKISL